MQYAQAIEDYKRIERAVLFIEENFRRQPELKEIAANIGLSEYHFQRLFSRWAGVSPKRFLQFLTLEYAKKLLAESRNLLDVTYEAGLSSPGRLHDLFITCEAMTPGEYKKKAAGLKITYGFHDSPFSVCLLSMTDRGICGLDFVPEGEQDRVLDEVKDKWPKATFVEDADQTRPFAERIFTPIEDKQALPLLLKGSNFQIKIWQALLKIPAGAVVSYNDIAAHIGQPKAARAVGNAVALNPIGFIIPCHRVIRKVGNMGDYRWGSARKKAILGWEASRKV